MSNVWDRLPEENSYAYRIFSHYLRQAVPRHVKQIFATENKTRPCSYATAAKYCNKYNWIERAAAYDDNIEIQKRTTLEREQLEQYRKDVKDMLKRQATAAQAYGSALVKMHEAFFRRIQGDPKLLDTLPVETLVRLIIRGASALPSIQEAERVARGVNPTLNLNMAEFDPSKMTNEELLGFITGQNDV